MCIRDRRGRECTPKGKGLLCKKLNGQLSEREEEEKIGTCPIDTAKLEINCPATMAEGEQISCTVKNTGTCVARSINMTSGAPLSLHNTATSNCGRNNGVIGVNASCKIDVRCPKPLGATSASSVVTVNYNDCKTGAVVTDTIRCNGTVEPPPVWGPWSSWTKGSCVNGSRNYSRSRSCTPNGKKCVHSVTGALVATESASKTVADPSCNVATCTVDPSLGTALPPANVVQAEFKARSGGNFHSSYLPQTGTQLTQAAYSQWKQFIQFEKCAYPGGKVEWKVKDYTSPVKTCEVYGSYGYRGDNSKYTIPCLMDKNGSCVKTWLDGRDHGYSSCMSRVHNGGGRPASSTDRVVNGKKLKFCAVDASCSEASTCTGAWGPWTDYGCNDNGYRARWRKCQAGKTCYDAVTKQCTTSMDEHSTTERCTAANACTGTWGPWTDYGCNDKGYRARWRKCPAGKTCYDAVKKQCTTSMDEHSTTIRCDANTTAGVCGSKRHNNNIVSIEAECSTRDYSNGGHSWRLVSRGGTSGGQAMESTPDNGTLRSTASGSPQVQYRVNFPSAGRYTVWVRGWSKDANSDNSVHVGINGRLGDSAKAMDNFKANAWTWSNDRQNTGSKAYIDVPKAGDHWVNVWMREDGFAYDKLLFSKDGNYRPSGTGPN